MSTLQCTNLQDTSGGNSLTTAQIYNGAAKAWVNFNGTGTPSIRASFNVSSITDNGTGYYTVNFTSALIDTNYNVTCGVSNPTYIEFWNIFDFPNGNYQAPTTSSFISTFYGQGSFRDPIHVMFTIHR